jgi:DNA-directed RNA polymerase specialized sigma24 family protein
MRALARRLDLKARDDEADARLAEALAALPKQERRSLILAYLGYPFYDIATLRSSRARAGRIRSGEDRPHLARRCDAIREGGAAAT